MSSSFIHSRSAPNPASLLLHLGHALRPKLVAALALGLVIPVSGLMAASTFHVEEATISDIQQAILAKQVTATEVVKLYLARIKAYNGPAVDQPYGILGPIKTIPHAKGINALSTLNLRPEHRRAWGFDDHHARSITDLVDADPAMPDALEVAAKLDAYFAKTGKLIGPLHGVVFALKDQYSTFDMRSTSGADAFYANDRPPFDSTFVERLRAAGAIILAKANLSEYADGIPRSSFGGTFANPYDTERNPGISSSGSGSSVGANLVTCAIAEETGSSIRGPAHKNSCVGISVTEELVSRFGMIQMGIQTRVGPIARTVEDAARVLSVIAGYDPKDPLTAFSVGRLPDQPYQTFTHEKSLKGLRIGVLREYMDKKLFTKADEENIDIVNRAIEDLRRLGATVIDPGEGGELVTKYIQALNPMLMNAGFEKEHPDMFPFDAAGKPVGDHIATLIDLVMDPSKAPGKYTLRDLGGMGGGGGGRRRAGAAAAASPEPGAGPAAAPPPAYGTAIGEARYEFNLYLRKRGDATIKTLTDLYTRANFYNDPNFASQKESLENSDKARVLDTASRMQRRFAVQEIILQAFADLGLDAVVYPTSNIPPIKLGAPAEPALNGRSDVWSFLGAQGFPVITVQAGFTTHVYDRIRDPSAPPPAPGWARGGGYPGATPPEPTILVGPTPAVLPVGMDIAGRPFSEPTLLRIAGAFQDATHHRHPPPDFGPLPAAAGN
jgi:Asp-tRNA(Asn)/Glu-tRNA(Gln) amidotransferase A subunit family amidase